MTSVLIPTLNEEKNVEVALESAADLSDDIVVLDSGSSDGTEAIVRRFAANSRQGTVRFISHAFEGYGKQWNWAIENVEWRYPWLFLLAADERITHELSAEIKEIFSNPLPENQAAFFMRRKFIWMGRWIRHGGIYPFWDARLFKIGSARYDDRGINEHLIINGAHLRLKGSIIHEDRRESLDPWTLKHLKYADLECATLLRESLVDTSTHLKPKLFGTQAERKRWLRYRVWNRIPPLIRPFIYFLYRYLFRLGFLDGKEGLVYHFLQGLWFPFLIDAKYIERTANPNLIDVSAPISYGRGPQGEKL